MTARRQFTTTDGATKMRLLILLFVLVAGGCKTCKCGNQPPPPPVYEVDGKPFQR